MDSSSTSDDECVYVDSVSRDNAQDVDDSVQIIAEIVPSTSRAQTEDHSSDSDAPVILHVKVNDIKPKSFKTRKVKVNFGDFVPKRECESNNAAAESNVLESNNAVPAVSNVLESNNSAIVSDALESNNVAPIVSNALESNNVVPTVSNALEFRNVKIKPENALECSNVQIESNNAPVKSENASTESNNAPVKSENASTESNNAPVKSENASTESNDTPKKSENATKSNMTPTKSENVMDFSNTRATEPNKAPAGSSDDIAFRPTISQVTGPTCRTDSNNSSAINWDSIAELINVPRQASSSVSTQSVRDMTALANELAHYISLDMKSKQIETLDKIEAIYLSDVQVPDHNPNNLAGVPGSSGLNRASRAPAPPTTEDYYIPVCMPIEDIYPPQPSVSAPELSQDTPSSSTTASQESVKNPEPAQATTGNIDDFVFKRPEIPPRHKRPNIPPHPSKDHKKKQKHALKKKKLKRLNDQRSIMITTNSGSSHPVHTPSINPANPPRGILKRQRTNNDESSAPPQQKLRVSFVTRDDIIGDAEPTDTTPRDDVVRIEPRIRISEIGGRRREKEKSLKDAITRLSSAEMYIRYTNAKKHVCTVKCKHVPGKRMPSRCRRFFALLMSMERQYHRETSQGQGNNVPGQPCPAVPGPSSAQVPSQSTNPVPSDSNTVQPQSANAMPSQGTTDSNAVQSQSANAMPSQGTTDSNVVQPQSANAVPSQDTNKVSSEPNVQPQTSNVEPSTSSRADDDLLCGPNSSHCKAKAAGKLTLKRTENCGYSVRPGSMSPTMKVGTDIPPQVSSQNTVSRGKQMASGNAIPTPENNSDKSKDQPEKSDSGPAQQKWDYNYHMVRLKKEHEVFEKQLEEGKKYWMKRLRSNAPQPRQCNVPPQPTSDSSQQQSTASNLPQPELAALRQELQELRAQVHTLIQQTSPKVAQQSCTGLPQHTATNQPQNTNVQPTTSNLLQQSTTTNLPQQSTTTNLPQQSTTTNLPQQSTTTNLPQQSSSSTNLPQQAASNVSQAERRFISQTLSPDAVQKLEDAIQRLGRRQYPGLNLPQLPAPNQPSTSTRNNDSRSPAFDYGNLPPVSGSLGVNLVVPNQAGVLRSLRVPAGAFTASSLPVPGLPGGFQVTGSTGVRTLGWTSASNPAPPIPDPGQRLNQIIERWIKNAPDFLRKLYCDQLIRFLHACNLVDTGLQTSTSSTEDRLHNNVRKITDGIKRMMNQFSDPTVRVRLRNRMTLFLQTMNVTGAPTQGQGTPMTSAVVRIALSSTAQQNPSSVLANMQSYFTPAQMQHIRIMNQVPRLLVPRPIPTYDLAALKVPGVKAMRCTNTVSVPGVLQPTDGVDPNTIKLFLPENWSCHQNFDLLDCNIVHVDEGSAEFQDVVDRISRTLPNRRVKAIHRIENPYLLVMFLLKKAEMIARHGHCSEQLLFHGTHSANMFNIIVDNLDWRKFGNNAGHTYGCGVYFGSSAFISSGYARNTMFLVRVLIYWIHNGTKQTTIPAHESDTTTSSDGSVTVKYDDFTYLPEYMVTFEDLPPRNKT